MTSVDFIVIGSGIAGLTAARELSHVGETLLISKGALGDGATQVAQGGIAAAMRKDDSPTFHYADTIRAGAGLCDPEAVRILVEEGPLRVRELIELGAIFDRVDGELDFTREAAHGQRRILHVGDATGREIGRTLGTVLQSEGKVKLLSHAMVVDLMMDNGRCVGCWVLQDGEILGYQASAVILATGGCGQIFRYNTNPKGATGDGIALAYRAGAALQDMEFIQFHPTTFAKPGGTPDSRFLITEAVRGEGAVLRNDEGQRFMSRYHPDAELAPRDVVARSIFQEMQRTGAGQVWLDMREIPLDLAARFPTIYAKCKAEGLDIGKDLIPVAPAAHYMMGGVKTDVCGQTSIPGLYAGGEVACLGVHGANRLASNSLLDGLVYGYRIASALLRNAQMKLHPPRNVPFVPFANSAFSTNAELRLALQDVMWEWAGISRSGEGLARLVAQLSDWQVLCEPRGADPESCETQNMLQVGLLMAQAALARTESRGSHYREDFPLRDDEHWSRHQVIVRVFSVPSTGS